MTHPLTPRENVAFKQPCEHCQRMTTVDLTALASGSGDHEELARLADMADWMADGDPGANGSVLLSASVASEHASDLKARLAETAALRAACSKSNDEISQTLGKALGYPWFKDDQVNFPGATAENGVCVSDHVAESLADEAARRLTEAGHKLDEAYRTARQFLAATSGTTYPSNHPMWAAIESAQQLLSKEAERG